MAAAVTLGGSLEQEQWAFFWGEVFGGIRVHEARRRGYLCGMRYGSVRHRVVGVSGSLGVVGCSALCLSPLFWGGGLPPSFGGVRFGITASCGVYTRVVVYHGSTLFRPTRTPKLEVGGGELRC